MRTARHSGRHIRRASEESKRSVVGILAPPVATFVAVEIFLWACARSARADPFRSVAWSHWDAGQYLWIARRGYYYFPCPNAPSQPCGNAGWFPGYSVLLRGGSALGLSPTAAGVVIATASFAGILMVVWVGYLGARVTLRNLFCLAVASVWFGQVYYHAVFPLSLAVLLILGSILLADRDRWGPAALLAGLSATVYASAFLLGIAGAVWILLLQRGLRWPDRIRRTALYCGAVAVGYLSVIVAMRLLTGRWTVYFDIERKYDAATVHNPWEQWRLRVDVFLRHGWGGGSYAASFQTLAVGAFMVALIVGAAVFWKRLGTFERFLVVYAIVFWLVPLSQGPRVDVYRSDALMLPAALLLSRVPYPLQAPVLCAELIAAYGTTVQYLQNHLH